MTPKEQIGHSILPDLPRKGIIGFGSGTTVNAIITVLGKTDEFKNVEFVAGSAKTSKMLHTQNLKEVAMSRIEICIDGADQVLKSGIILKGGGGALFREKVLWQMSKSIIIGITEDKLVDRLTVPLPIEIDPFARELVETAINNEYPSCKIVLREKSGTAFVTDNGNWILDCIGLLEAASPEDAIELKHALKSITGVIETGLFVGMEIDCLVLIASEDGIRRTLLRI